MAAAVKSAPRPGIAQRPRGEVDPKKEAEKKAAEKLEQQIERQTPDQLNTDFLPKETAEELVGWAKDRLARIAKTRNPSLVMFCIGKSENENTVVYMGNLKPGTSRLRDDGPAATGFWIEYKKKADGSTEDDLTFFERRMAYGVNVQLVQGSPCEANMSIVALPTKPLRVRIEKLAGESKPRILARVKCCGVQHCRLLGVYVTCKTGFIPGVKHIDIIAQHPKTGAPLAERVG